jgi:TonB family protein
LPPTGLPQEKIIETKAAGFCDKGQVSGVVKARQGTFKFCYEKELQLYPNLAGGVTVRFTISEAGAVANAAIASSSIASKKVEECVLDTVKKLKFPPPEGGVCVVNWPFKFTPTK